MGDYLMNHILCKTAELDARISEMENKMKKIKRRNRLLLLVIGTGIIVERMNQGHVRLSKNRDENEE